MNMRDIILLKKLGGGGSDLPPVTAADNGKLLGVEEGAWGKVDPPSGGTSDYERLENKPILVTQTVYPNNQSGTEGMLFGQAIYKITGTFLSDQALIGGTLNDGAISLTDGNNGAGNVADISAALGQVGFSGHASAFSPSDFQVTEPFYDFAIISTDTPIVVAEMYVNLPTAGTWALASVASVELPPVTTIPTKYRSSFLPANDLTHIQRIQKRAIQVNTRGAWAMGAAPSLMGPASWLDFRQLVKLGLAKSMFPEGTMFNVSAGIYGNWPIIIVAYDKDLDPDDANAHTVTLHSLRGLRGISFSEREAICKFPSGCPAGQYFVKSGQGVSSTAYSFTLTEAIPAGGKLTFGSNYNNPFTEVRSWASLGATAPLETASTTASDESGTDIETVTGVVMNYYTRAMWGNGNWGESSVRPFLNADGIYTFQRTNDFSMAPSYDGEPGFLGQLDPEFAAILLATEQVTGTNLYYENSGYTVDSTYITRDKVFLPSHTQIGGTAGWTGEKTEGETWDLFDGLDASDQPLRVRWNMDHPDEAVWWWLRSCYPSDPSYARIVGDDGYADYTYDAYSRGYAVAPAFVI